MHQNNYRQKEYKLFPLRTDNKVTEYLKQLTHWISSETAVPIVYCDPLMSTHFETPPAPWFSIFLIVEGEIFFKVGDNSLKANKGTLLLLNAHYGNKGILQSRKGRYACLSLNIQNCRPLAKAMNKPVLYSVHIKEYHYIHSCFIKMSLAYHSPSQYFPETYLKSVILELLISILNNIAIVPHEHYKETSPIIRKAITFIEENQADPDISLKDIATNAGVSVGHMEKQFRREKQISPMRYLLELRLQRAKNLLLNTNLLIKEIALTIGFTDPLYFSRQFHKKNGFSPKEFRNKYLHEQHPSLKEISK